MKQVSHKKAYVRNPDTGEFEPLMAIRGESAYEIAVRLGKFTGTEEEWANYIEIERAAAVKSVEDKGAETLASIPDDYVALQEQVDNKIDKTSIAHELGDSEDKVLSQKAATEAFNEIAEVVYSKNLFNKNDSDAETNIFYATNSADRYETDKWNTTGYIEVNNGDHVTLSAREGVADQSAVYFRTVSIFDADKNLIRVGQVSGTNEYVKDYIVDNANVSYIRASMAKEVWDSPDAMIEITTDGVSTEFEPYFEPHFEAKGLEELKKSVEELGNSLEEKTKPRFYGKKFTALGDSITQGGTWFPKINEFFNTNIVNCGYSGRRLIDIVNQNSETDYFGNIPADTEVLLVMLGMNDWANNTPLGEKKITNTDITTFRGAVNVLIQKIMERIPNATIICMGVSFGYYPDRSTFTDKTGLYNNLDMTSVEYGREFVDMCGLNGIEGFNIGELCGWNVNNIATYCISDGAYIHPNNSFGGVVMANAIINKLK